MPFLYSFRLCLCSLYKNDIFSYLSYRKEKASAIPLHRSMPPKCLGSYILAFIAGNELQTIYAPDDKQISNNHLWRWAHKLLHTSAVDQRESKTPVTFPIDSSAKDFSLLRDTMRWFWPLEQLTDLIYDSDIDFQSRLDYQTAVRCNLPFQEECEEIAKKMVSLTGSSCSRALLMVTKQFLKDNLHLPKHNT